MHVHSQQLAGCPGGRPGRQEGERRRAPGCNFRALLRAGVPGGGPDSGAWCGWAWGLLSPARGGDAAGIPGSPARPPWGQGGLWGAGGRAAQAAESATPVRPGEESGAREGRPESARRVTWQVGVDGGFPGTAPSFAQRRA